MRTAQGVIILEDAVSISPKNTSIYYTDQSGTRIQVPTKLLLRLHSVLQADVERAGGEWETYCATFFD